MAEHTFESEASGDVLVAGVFRGGDEIPPGTFHQR